MQRESTDLSTDCLSFFFVCVCDQSYLADKIFYKFILRKVTSD